MDRLPLVCNGFGLAYKVPVKDPCFLVALVASVLGCVGKMPKSKESARRPLQFLGSHEGTGSRLSVVCGPTTPSGLGFRV